MLAQSPEWPKVRELLELDGIECLPDWKERLEYHLTWVRQWNHVGSFVSSGDEALLEAHTFDSIALVPYGKDAATWLDIGSGGGFPAIPVALVLPNVRMTMVERSEKKAGLLIGLVASLHLQNVDVVVGSFPHAVTDHRPSVVTARAVERPERVHKDIASLVDRGAVFLCQSDTSQWKREMFHVEQLVDSWSEAHLRRGMLHRITPV